MIKLTIKRLNTREIQLPSHVLSVDIPQVSDEESIFLASIACLMIDILYSILEGIAY